MIPETEFPNLQVERDLDPQSGALALRFFLNDQKVPSVRVTGSEREVLNRTSRTIAWKGRYPVPMYFDEAELQDPMIGYIAVSNTWPADEFTQLSTLYDKALLRAAEEVPALPPDYNFG